MLHGIDVVLKDDYKVEVLSTNNRGHNSDELSELCVRRIIAFSNTGGPIDLQINLFREECRQVIKYYMDVAMNSNFYKNQLFYDLNGRKDIAAIIQRIWNQQAHITTSSLDSLASQCVDRIISVDTKSAPEFLKRQAFVFKDKCLEIIRIYLGKAVDSSNTTIGAQLLLNNIH